MEDQIAAICALVGVVFTAGGGAIGYGMLLSRSRSNTHRLDTLEPLLLQISQDVAQIRGYLEAKRNGEPFVQRKQH